MPDFWFHHSAVSVPNLDEAIRWYGEKLGFQLERRAFIAGIPSHMAMVRNGPLRIELFEATGSRPPAEDRSDTSGDVRTHGNKHVAFGIADVRALAATLAARGVDIAWAREDVMFIRDHAGNLIEFMQCDIPSGTTGIL